VLYDWLLKYDGGKSERRAGQKGKSRSHGLESGSAGEGKCIELRGILDGVIFFFKSASSATWRAIALRYAITRIYWCIIPFGPRRERIDAHLYTNSESIRETFALHRE